MPPVPMVLGYSFPFLLAFPLNYINIGGITCLCTHLDDMMFTVSMGRGRNEGLRALGMGTIGLTIVAFKFIDY